MALLPYEQTRSPLFGPLTDLEDDPDQALTLLPLIAKVFAALEQKIPQVAPILESLKPSIVLDVAVSTQPGAMDLLGSLGLFPKTLPEEGDTLLRSAVARANFIQKPALMRLMVEHIRLH